MAARDSNRSVRRRLNVAELETRLGCNRRTIRDWYTEGDFPRPHYLGTGPNARRLWWLDEVEEWEIARASRPPPAGPPHRNPRPPPPNRARPKLPRAAHG